MPGHQHRTMRNGCGIHWVKMMHNAATYTAGCPLRPCQQRSFVRGGNRWSRGLRNRIAVQGPGLEDIQLLVAIQSPFDILRSAKEGFQFPGGCSQTHGLLTTERHRDSVACSKRLLAQLPLMHDQPVLLATGNSLGGGRTVRW